MQASHGTYYGFYSVYLEQLGFPRGQIGLLWALGVGLALGGDETGLEVSIHGKRWPLGNQVTEALKPT